MIILGSRAEDTYEELPQVAWKVLSLFAKMDEETIALIKEMGSHKTGKKVDLLVAYNGSKFSRTGIPVLYY